jgi:hypothetical protein
MLLRRRRFKTAFLASLVHPTPLLEALRELQTNGDIEWFEYGKYNCTIKLTKYSGLDMIIKEASQPVAIQNSKRQNRLGYNIKTNERTLRKTKS